MAKIQIDQIKDNPWRNFELYPLDKEQVKQLTRSIDAHGFFGGIKARRTPDGIELGCGHHRIKACKEAGLSEVDIIVDDMDDDEMIRLMCSENATQRGAVAGAIMNEVAAATRRIATSLLQGNNATVVALFPNWSRRSIDIARGRLENGDGVGERAIGEYLRGARPTRQIRDAVGSLKDSGVYTKILQEIDAEFGQEADAAEDEERTTPDKPEAKAKTKQKKNAKDKATKASTSSKKHKRIYDERCAAVFATESQHEAFKRAVTSASGRKFIAVSAQYALAQKILGAVRPGGRAGAPFIQSYVSSEIKKAIALQRDIDTEEKERLERDNRRESLDARINSMMIHMRSMIKDAIKVRDMLLEDQSLRTESAKLGVLVNRKDDLMTTLKSMWKAAGV